MQCLRFEWIDSSIVISDQVMIILETFLLDTCILSLSITVDLFSIVFYFLSSFLHMPRNMHLDMQEYLILKLSDLRKHKDLLSLTFSVCVLGRVQLFCSPTDCSPPGSSAHGISQTRLLEWVAISSSRWSSWPKDRTYISCVSCTGRQVVYH